MLFLDTMTLERELLPFPADSEFLVMHSGVPRSLASSDYNQRRAECETAAALLGVQSLRMVDDPAAVERLPSPLRERARHVITENQRVLAARNSDAEAFGVLMMQSHASLRDDYAVSLPAIDALVAALLREPGVFGARLTGAGFGGCCVAVVRQGTAAATGYRVATCFGEVPSIIVPSDR
jgi:galactokinase